MYVDNFYDVLDSIMFHLHIVALQLLWRGRDENKNHKESLVINSSGKKK